MAWGDVFSSFLLVLVYFPLSLRRILMASAFYTFIFVFVRLFMTINSVSMLLRIQMKAENLPLMSHREVWPLAKRRKRKSRFSTHPTLTATLRLFLWGTQSANGICMCPENHSFTYHPKMTSLDWIAYLIFPFSLLFSFPPAKFTCSLSHHLETLRSTVG